MSDISVFGDSVLKGVIYENNVYKVSKNRFSNICEEILGISIENKAKFGSTINVGKNIISKNIDLIKETNSKYVVMEFGGNDCDYNWVEISENPNKEYQPKSTINEFIETYSNLIEKLQICITTISKVPDVLHHRLKELLLQYVVVGGMPAVVNEFTNSKMMNKVLQMQRDIVNGYRDDMMKYATPSDKSKIRECFDSIPKQLGKENKKFQYSIIRKKGTAAMFAGALQWIEDAGIIKRCYNLSITELPLEGNAIDNVFKVYMADIGLFVCMLEDGTAFDILRGSLLGYKGAIYENLVADFLTKSGRKLYYFHKDSGLEIDFVIRRNGKCVLLECKASSGNVKSTKTILNHPEKYHVYDAIKLGDYNVGLANNILTLPLYMGFLLGNDNENVKI